MDIYDDLENYDEVFDTQQLLSENAELKQKLEENSAALDKLKQDFEKLSAEHQQLLINFSALLKTAKAEIERKTQSIMQINIEKDQLFLQLASTRMNRKMPMSQKNENVAAKIKKKRVRNFEAKENNAAEAMETPKVENIESINNFSYETRSKLRHKNKDENTKNFAIKPSTPVSFTDKRNEDNLRTDAPEIICTPIDARQEHPSKFCSDQEDGEIADDSIDLRDKINRIKTQESSVPLTNTKDTSRDLSKNNNKYSRTKEFNINKDRFNFYRHKEKFPEKLDTDRLYRSRAPDRDFSNDRFNQRGRSRHRNVDSPSQDKYHRERSRGRRNDNKDRYYNNSELKQNHDRLKHKASDTDVSEPSRKKRRHSMYDAPLARSRRLSGPYDVMEPTCEEEKGNDAKMDMIRSSLGERLQAMSCQSPDDPFLERNVPPAPLKLISHTAISKLEDPRESSRRYIKIYDKDHKPSLVVARASNVQLKKIQPWLDDDSKPADEDKVAEIYADIDKQITNMSIEADRSSEKKEKPQDNQVDDLDLFTMNKDQDKNIKEPNKTNEVKENSVTIIHEVKSQEMSQEEKEAKAKDVMAIIKKYKIPKKGSKNTAINEAEKTVSSERIHKEESGNKEENTDTILADSVLQSTVITKDTTAKNVIQNSNEIGMKIDINTDSSISITPIGNPLELLFKHLKSEQAKSKNQQNSILNKTDDTSKYCSLNNQEKEKSEKEIKLRKGIVEGDLELSDETSDFTSFKEKFSSNKKDELKSKSNKEKPKKKSLKLKTTNSDENTKNTVPSDKAPAIDKKTQEMKAKFSDLFGDTTSSLITPEDLDLPRTYIDNYPCIPSVESTNEAWSLQSPWKPSVDLPKQKPTVIVENTMRNNQKVTQNLNVESDHCTNNENNTCISLELTKPKVSDHTVIVSPNTQTKLNSKEVTINNFENDFQVDYKTPLKALATSTPMRTNVERVVAVENSQSKVSEESKLSRIMEESKLSRILEDSMLSKILEEPNLSKILEESKVSKNPEDTKLSKILEKPKLTKAEEAHNIPSIQEDHKLSNIQTESSSSKVIEVSESEHIDLTKTYQQTKETASLLTAGVDVTEEPVISQNLGEHTVRNSFSNIAEDTSSLLKDLEVSNSSQSHTAIENDVPDVRIVIKRKRRVLKK